MRPILLSCLAGLVLTAGCIALPGLGLPVARSETELKSEALRRLVTYPSGKNGLEEILLASESVKASRRFQDLRALESADGSLRQVGAYPEVREYLLRDETIRRAAAGGYHLAAKRDAVRDAPVVRALKLLERAATKRIAAPAALPPGEVIELWMPFVRMGNLLRTEVYVSLADGRVRDALEFVRLGLRLDAAVRGDGLILAGHPPFSRGSLRVVGERLDQIPAAECDLLLQICREALRRPDGLGRWLERKRSFEKWHLDTVRAGLRERGLRSLSEDRYVGTAPENDEESREEQRLLADLERQLARPQGLDRFFMQVETLANEVIDHEHAENRKPAWERSVKEYPADGSLAARFLGQISPFTFSLADQAQRFTANEAYLRLVACHAAIQRHRWEYDRLPEDLHALSLGELAVDPFTGSALRYEVRGSRYHLWSVGPATSADRPGVVNGRRPVSVRARE